MNSESPNRRKPCIALMGEFSAGKSTLANLLIGSHPLPVQIVATQLPPVWIKYGDGMPYSVDIEGVKRPVDLHDLAGVDLDQLAYLQIFSTEDLLEHCDLMDMPGISDPNIASSVWERMMDQADGVLWCSHATQAWRQSEAAVWDQMPRDLYERSLLLLTRADKLRSSEDRKRVVRRVQSETEGLFRACLPISLLLAMQEQDDYALWSESGAEEFVQHLVTLLEQLNREINVEAAAPGLGEDLRLPGFKGPDKPREALPCETELAPKAGASRVVPRRIASSQSGTRRPAPSPRNHPV